MDEEDSSATEGVFEMLKADHRRVEELFTQFEDADKRGAPASPKRPSASWKFTPRLKKSWCIPPFAR